MSGFAAGLRRKRKPEDLDTAYTQPKYAVASQVSGTWTTFDPSSGTVQYDKAWKSGDTGDRFGWIDQPPKFEDDDEIARENQFKNRFVTDQDLLDDSRPKNEFEARNASLLGLGAGGGSGRVRTKWGDVELKRDNRAARNDRGRAHDGNSCGLAKKRHIEEHKRRRAERDAEMQTWYPKWQAWQDLPQDEKQKMRDQQQERNRKLMEALFFTEVEDVPDDVQGLSFELETLEIDQEAEQIPSSPSAFISVSSPTHNSVDVAIESDNPWGEQRQRSHRPTPIPLEYQGIPDASASSPKSESPRLPKTSNPFSNLPGHPVKPPSLPAPSGLHQLPFGSTNRRAFTLPFRPNTRQRAGSIAGQSTKTSTTVQPVYTSLTFDVNKDPNFQPFEDITRRPMLAHSDVVVVERLVKLSQHKGRVVVIRLDDTVSTEQFGERITDRMWGGLVQEIQLFPEYRHAVVCFLTPTAASAFLRHVLNTKWNSEHEYRRLQIAAGWYKGAENGGKDAGALWPAQENVIRAVIADGASRVLILDRIDKDLPLAELRRTMTEEASRLQHSVVRGRLVRPVKLYEKADRFCNKLVVEFAAIRDAVAVRDEVNAGRLDGFHGCRAEFAKDPVDEPHDPPMPFCDCRYCKMDWQKKGPQA